MRSTLCPVITLTLAFGAAAKATDLQRWVYSQNLCVDENVDDIATKTWNASAKS
jgi:hypothetical protein